jgi:hypothetical protein
LRRYRRHAIVGRRNAIANERLKIEAALSKCLINARLVRGPSFRHSAWVVWTIADCMMAPNTLTMSRAFCPYDGMSAPAHNSGKRSDKDPAESEHFQPESVRKIADFIVGRPTSSAKRDDVQPWFMSIEQLASATLSLTVDLVGPS